MASHLNEGCVSINKLTQVARSKRLALAEEATQTQGVVIQGRMARASCDVGVSSSGRSKLPTAGRGASPQTIAKTVRRFNDYGFASRYNVR